MPSRGTTFKLIRQARAQLASDRARFIDQQRRHQQGRQLLVPRGRPPLPPRARQPVTVPAADGQEGGSAGD